MFHRLGLNRFDFLHRRRWGRRRSGICGRGFRRRRRRRRRGRMKLAEFFLEILTRDLVERAGGDLGVGNAQFFRLRDDFFALDPQSFGYVVYANGHKLLQRAACLDVSSCQCMRRTTGRRQAGASSPTLSVRRVTSALADSKMVPACSPTCGMSAKSDASTCNRSSKLVKPA